MSSSRPLRPRSSRGPPSDPPGTRSRILIKRISRVSQACGTCRQRKLKCDGRRPVCDRCSIRNEGCEYASDAVVASSRLEALESLIDTLKFCPPDRAASLLEKIRTTDDVATLVAETDATGNLRMAERWQSQEQTSQRHMRPSQLTGDRVEPAVLLTTPPSPNPQQNLLDLLVPRELPDEGATLQAINNFFMCSAQLFHVFSKEQLNELVKTAFYDNSQSSNKRIIAMSCFSIVAAIGCQYDTGESHHELEDTFYYNAKCGLELMIEFSVFETIKLCSLLAMYNCMNKGTVALAYLDIGLSLAKMHGLYETKCPHKTVTQAEWSDYRQAWRLLVFLSSWLSATLGYLSGNETLLNIPLSAINTDKSQDIEEIVKAEMTKISLLKVTILRLHLAFKDITIPILESAMQDLEKWHGELPSAMKIANLGRGDLSIGLRRSIYYTHLLHLGAIMQVHQRIAYESHPESNRVPQYDSAAQEIDPLYRLAGYGVIAAKHSARILDLLMADDGVFCRCWIVILQAFTSCIVILHAVVQERLHGFPRVVSDQNLVLASKCLAVLEYCSKMDQVALKLHKKMAICYEKVLGFASSDPTTATGHNCGGDHHSFEILEESSAHLLQIPPSTDPDQRALSLELLEILCVLFGNANSGLPSECTEWWPNDTRFGDLQVPHCDMERDTMLFDVGAKSLIECAMTSNARLGKGWFLGSREPYGWSTAGFPKIR